MAGNAGDDRASYTPSQPPAQAFMEPNSNQPGVSSDDNVTYDWSSGAWYHDNTLADTTGVVQPTVNGGAFDATDDAQSANVYHLEHESTPIQQYFDNSFSDYDTTGLFDNEASDEMLIDSTPYGTIGHNGQWHQGAVAPTAASGEQTDLRYSGNASTDAVHPASIDPSSSALYSDATLTTSDRQEASISMADSSVEWQEPGMVRMCDTQPIRVDSWSAFNTRSDKMYSISPMRLQTINDVHASDLASTNLSVEYDESSVPESHPAMSRTTFEDEVNLAITDPSSHLSYVQGNYQMQPPTYLNVMIQTQGPLASLPSRLVQTAANIGIRLREGTPPQEPIGDGHVIDGGVSDTGLRPGPWPVPSADTGFLKEPSSPSEMSIDSSLWSVASASVPLILSCTRPRCKATFSGNYRKGNLARHEQVVHELARACVCAAPGCPRSFKRSDARRKHYKKYHPHLLASQPKRDHPENGRDHASFFWMS